MPIEHRGPAEVAKELCAGAVGPAGRTASLRGFTVRTASSRCLFGGL